MEMAAANQMNNGRAAHGEVSDEIAVFEMRPLMVVGGGRPFGTCVFLG
jgi:hypothetical protein